MSGAANLPQDLEPFIIALKMEREGKRLFLEAAETTTSKLARQTFEYLAREEDKHIEKIEKFYTRLVESGGEDIPNIEDSTADAKLESFNQSLECVRDEFKATASDIEAYRLALQFESGTEEFYEQQLQKTGDPAMRRFYKWLIDEEAMHGHLLKSCLRFVEDPTEWFRRRKRPERG